MNDQTTALLEQIGAWMQALAEADLDEGAADTVTVGMVFQQQASSVYLPRIRAALHKGNTNVQG